MPEMSAETIRGQVEALRHKLLDLSMRNRMLNYRPSRRLGVTILGEDARDVHKTLVGESKKMGFVGKPDLPVVRAKAGSAIAFPPAALPLATAAIEPVGEAPVLPEIEVEGWYE